MENGQRGVADLLGRGRQAAVMLDPVWISLVVFAPNRFEHPLGPLDLLHGGCQRFPALGQVGDVPDKEAADALLAEDRLQEHDDGDRKSTRLNSSHLGISY